MDYADRIETVFIGGGTPTILPLDELDELLTAVGRAASPPRVREFTIEANPATVGDEKANLLVRHGVTRVSMGAQSFFPAELAVLERLHSPGDIKPSVATLRRCGVAEVNLDLIFGIPGQTNETWAESLSRAIDLEPDHIACYGLTYEPGTPLTGLREFEQIEPVEEGLEAELYSQAIETLSDAGYAQYEISNFARPGRQCQHNLIYWRNGPYIGVGPSAAGCVDGRRYKNVADVAGYIRMVDSQGHAEFESETIDTPTLMTEMIMMQLRLLEGLSIAAFCERTGIEPLRAFRKVLPRLFDLGFVAVSDTHIVLTRKGRLIGDAVMAELATACDNSSDAGSPDPTHPRTGGSLP